MLFQGLYRYYLILTVTLRVYPHFTDEETEVHSDGEAADGGTETQIHLAADPELSTPFNAASHSHLHGRKQGTEVKYWLGPKLLALEGSPKKGPGYYKGDMNGKHLAQKRTIPKITLQKWQCSWPTVHT
jgi:hypothetical protein